jgi:hypothetical protein
MRTPILGLALAGAMAIGLTLPGESQASNKSYSSHSSHYSSYHSYHRYYSSWWCSSWCPTYSCYPYCNPCPVEVVQPVVVQPVVVQPVVVTPVVTPCYSCCSSCYTPFFGSHYYSSSHYPSQYKGSQVRK